MAGEPLNWGELGDDQRCSPRSSQSIQAAPMTMHNAMKTTASSIRNSFLLGELFGKRGDLFGQVRHELGQRGQCQYDGINGGTGCEVGAVVPHQFRLNGDLQDAQFLGHHVDSAARFQVFVAVHTYRYEVSQQ